VYYISFNFFKFKALDLEQDDNIYISIKSIALFTEIRKLLV